MTIRELYEARERARRGWRGRPNGYESMGVASSAYAEAGEVLRQRLPVPTTVAYAYSPRENVGSGGTYHIVVREPLAAGRLRREVGDALCRPRSRFWALEKREPPATCVRCLEMAERLARGTAAGAAGGRLNGPLP